jgi:hypothetical protein
VTEKLPPKKNKKIKKTTTVSNKLANFLEIKKNSET